jgi:integrase
MGLYKRGKTWWMCLSVNGRRIRHSTGTDNRKLAEAIFSKVKVRVIEGTWFETEKTQKARRITFSEMVRKYMQKYQKERDPYTIKKLLPAFGQYTLAEITTEMISDYMEERLNDVKPATVYQELALMRRIFNVARREWKWIKENPVADLSFSVGNKNARARWLTMEEEKRLLDKATNPQWLRPLLIVALHTGMRKGEILNLKWQDIDLFRKTVTVVKSKNGEKRTIPMSNTLFNTLNSLNVRHISGRVFPISYRSLRAAFGKAIEKAGIENFRIHDLRHTFATRLVQNGVDLYKVKELLGHKTISMTTRYAHHYPESLRGSVEVLDILSQICHNQGFSEVQKVRQNG